MRKIEEQMINAIERGVNWRKSNTEVKSHGDFSEVFLHDNHIATVNRVTGDLWINSCAWNTPTTKSRLNALGANIRQIRGKWYLGDYLWRFRFETLHVQSQKYMRFPDVLTEEERKEKYRLAEIESQKNSRLADIKRAHRQYLREVSKMYLPNFC